MRDLGAAVSDHSALQRIPEPGTESHHIGGMIDEILMKRCGDKVLNSRFYRVGGESCAQSLPKSFNPTPILSWMVEYLADACLRDHASKRTFTESGLFPVLSVGMRFPISLLCRSIRGCKGNDREDYVN